MSTVERKEYQETKILRTVSPTYQHHHHHNNNTDSRQNLTEFDSNLHNLLEDLQSTVSSRPGSSLGYGQTNQRTTSTSTLERHNRGNSLNRVQVNASASSNPVTEYSSDDTYNYSSPDGSRNVSGYKKESYSYKTGVDLGRQRQQQQLGNELDTLLDDLQQVKSKSYIATSGIDAPTGDDPDLRGRNNVVTSSKRSVHRELHYDDDPLPTSGGVGGRGGSGGETRRTVSTLERRRNYQYGGEKHTSPVPPPPPPPQPLLPTQSRSSTTTATLTKQQQQQQRVVDNVNTYPVEVIEEASADLINPEILAHLDPNLHPPGNTKVTTTIKTYTYEIPGSGAYPTNLAGIPHAANSNTVVDITDTEDKYIYSPNNNNNSNGTLKTTASTPSRSFVYKKSSSDKYEIEDDADTTNFLPYQKPQPPLGATNTTNIRKETVTTRNYQPGYISGGTPPQTRDHQHQQQRYVYNESVTTRNVIDGGGGSVPREKKQVQPQRSQVIDLYARNYEDDVLEENVNVTNKPNGTSTPHNYGYPQKSPKDGGGSGTDQRYVYKEEHHHHHHHHYGHNHHDGDDDGSRSPQKLVAPTPNEPINIQYTYTSESKTSNNYKTDNRERGGGYGDGNDSSAQPLLRPFPTTDGVDGPPKKLDDLMANIGQEPPTSALNAGYTLHERELEQRKKVDALKQRNEADDATNVERTLIPVQRSKNVSGPAVYYPPGHELFAKKEEGGGGAWRAEGAYGRESGKYMYESESKSKSKMSGGATVVPVCLPLCCGLPCTII